MCGIAGIWDVHSQARTEQELLEKMAAVLRHRGPDDQGVYLSGNLGFAHRRLSIVDLAGGHQPMSNEDDSLWVVYNGEVFNYPELRSELERQGHCFKTHCDTEVLVHLYEEKGNRFVESLNGQFAIALWDGRRRQLLLARDRLGVRPLFYTFHRGRFLFASEIKAIFQDPNVPRQLDPFALDQIFTFWFPIPPRTGFQNIAELPPGHILVVNEQGTELSRYWDLKFPTDQVADWVSSTRESSLINELMELLEDAVRIRLRADVPVAAYLSGGLDSSVVTALALRRLHERLKTFSIGFESHDFDETKYQARVVEHLKTEHHPFFCRSTDIGNEFPLAVWHMERPVVRTAPVPMMFLSRGVREAGIKVVLTGEGADEILAGYDIFKEALIRRFWARNPSSKWRPLLLRRLYPYLPGLKSQSSEYLKAFFGQGLSQPEDPFFSLRPRWQVASSIKVFYGEEVRNLLKDYDPVAELRDLLPEEFSRWHPLSQAQYLEAAYLLPGYILSSQGDRMGMANAVEGRFPFLDHRVVEFSAQLPPRLRMRVLREKHILREGARHLLPMETLERHKQPYRAPDHAAFFPNGKLHDPLSRVLSPANLAECSLFSASSVQALVEKAKRQESLGTRDGMALTGVLSTQLLFEQFIKKSPEESLGQYLKR